MQKIPKIVSRALLLITMISGAVACSKSVEQEENTFSPVKYEMGLPDGGFVEKTMNASGGVITSTDGKLRLSVPAGALTTSTVVSIQAIKNTVPLGTGSSFRILPADLSLSKPVTITLAYNEAELDGVDEEALDLTTQDNAGTWKRMKRTQLNRSNKTLTVETDHLGDFSFSGNYLLSPRKAGLAAGETTQLTVNTVQEKNTDEDEEEAPLGGIIPISNSGDFDTWNASGPGTIKVNGSTAEFTAPSSINGTETTDITVVLKNVKRPARLPNGKLLLRKKIVMAAGNFMAGYYDGQPFTCIGVSVTVGGGITTIQGVTADGKSVLMFVHGTDIGNYPIGNPTQSGKSEIRCNITGDVYESVYTTCGPPSSTNYAGGAVKVEGYQNGSTLAGQFNSTLYDDSGCQIKTKDISGSFRVKM